MRACVRASSRSGARFVNTTQRNTAQVERRANANRMKKSARKARNVSPVKGSRHALAKQETYRKADVSVAAAFV